MKDSTIESIEELETEFSRVKEMIQLSYGYGGKVKVGSTILTTQMLKDWLENIKFEIAARKSENHLRLV